MSAGERDARHDNEARTLAKLLMWQGFEQNAVKLAREALDIARAEGVREERERAAVISDGWATSKSCASHDDNPCCHVRTGAGIAAAIRDEEVLEAIPRALDALDATMKGETT